MAKMRHSFKRKHAADAANIYIRNLLCNVSRELGGFFEQDWEETLKYFDNKCPYTNEKLQAQDTVLDHLIPHNRKHCGLHLYGNIIPTSRRVNSCKAGKTFEDFIISDTRVYTSATEDQKVETIEKSREFQEKSGYLNKVKNLDLLKKIG